MGPAQVSASLAEKGLEVDSKVVILKAVKELGSYTATVQLHKEVFVEVPFEVVPEVEAEA